MTIARTWRTSSQAFALPSFGWLFSASATLSFATLVERTAIGWLVLDSTGSVFLTAMSWAVRSAPGMVVGPVAGALADRVSRSQLLVATTGTKAIVVCLLALLATTDNPPIALVLLLTAMSGACNTAGLASLQTLTRDIAGPEQAMSAISLNTFGQRAVGTAGPIIAGFLIEGAGTSVALLLAVAFLVVAAGLFLLIQSAAPAASGARAFRGELAAGIRLIFRHRTVATLLLLMLLAENLGFSTNALLPSVADDVLDVGAAGFGALTTALGVGAMLGLLTLATLGDYRRKGLLLTGVVGSFGVLMIALGASEFFAIGLVVCIGLGAAMAGVDALEWVLLQAAVDDELRGRAIGAWNFAIGFGWVGPIVLGGAASIIGVQGALIVSGTLLAVTGVVASRMRVLTSL